jgi:hypothetical protein
MKRENSERWYQLCDEATVEKSSERLLELVTEINRTGKMAFPGKSSAIVFKTISDEAPPAIIRLDPSLPTKLDEILSNALDKDRVLRYESVADFRTDLKRLKRDTESGRIAVRPVGAGAKVAPIRRRVFEAFAASIMVITVTLLAWRISRRVTTTTCFSRRQLHRLRAIQGR